jgi:hypothetical protein
MIDRKSLKRPQSFRRQFQQHAPAIIAIVLAPNQASLLASHAQFHYAVVPQPKTLRNIANRRGNSLWPTCNLQQELMLLWLKIKLRRRRLAEVKKQPELVAKFR